MSRCNAWASSTDRRCSNNAIRGSKYCWHHQSKPVLVFGFGSFIALVTLLFAVLQYWQASAEPNLYATISLRDDRDPCFLQCTIVNTGRKVANDVIVSFVSGLPAETVISASPELKITLEPERVLPNPNISAELAEYKKAFTIRIPRVPKKSEINFVLISNYHENERAANQLRALREIIEPSIRSFCKMIKETDSTYEDLDVDQVLSKRYKSQNQYKPSFLIYETARKQIDFISYEERRQSTMFYDAYENHKGQFKIATKRRYHAPVFYRESKDGPIPVTMFVDFLETYIARFTTVNRGIVDKEKGIGELEIYPKAPKKYEFEQ